MRLIEAGIQSDDTSFEMSRGLLDSSSALYRLGARVMCLSSASSWKSPFLGGPFKRQAEVLYFSPVRRGSEVPTREVGYFAHSLGRQATVSTIVLNDAVGPLFDMIDVVNGRCLRYAARIFAHDLLDAVGDTPSDEEAQQANPLFELSATLEELHLILDEIQEAQDLGSSIILSRPVTAR